MGLSQARLLLTERMGIGVSSQASLGVYPSGQLGLDGHVESLPQQFTEENPLAKRKKPDEHDIEHWKQARFTSLRYRIEPSTAPKIIGFHWEVSLFFSLFLLLAEDVFSFEAAGWSRADCVHDPDQLVRPGAAPLAVAFSEEWNPHQAIKGGSKIAPAKTPKTVR